MAVRTKFNKSKHTHKNVNACCIGRNLKFLKKKNEEVICKVR